MKVVSGTETARIQQWLDLFVTCLSEISNRPSDGMVDLPAEDDSHPVGLSVDERIRSEIGRYAALPPQHSNRSCGCTPWVIDRVAAFLKRSFSLPLSTQLVALALGFESSYFAKRFKSHTGESMVKNLRRVRLQRARELLRNPFLSVQEVATRTGFSDASYFTRVFRGELGVTPVQYRTSTMTLKPARSEGQK